MKREPVETFEFRCTKTFSSMVKSPFLTHSYLTVRGMSQSPRSLPPPRFPNKYVANLF